MEFFENVNFIYISNLKNNIKSKNNDKIFLETKKENEKSRYYIFDNFKGILIFIVVYAHFIFDYSNLNNNTFCRKLVVFIYSFHMQAFIFISGFLSSENSIKFSNAFKLLILYYIFNYSFSIIIYFYINANIEFLAPQSSYWYILSLFSWRITIKYINRVKFIVIISIIISLLEGYWPCINNAFSVSKTIAFYPYFLVGFKISKKKNFEKFLIWKSSKIKLFLFIISFLAFLSLVINYIRTVEITNYSLLMSNYNEKSTIKERIILIIISSNFIVFFLLLLPNIKIPCINKWGKNSLYIYLFHRIFTIISQRIFFSKKKYSNYIIEYSFAFSLIIILIFGSEFTSKICNSILISIHKNLLEYNKKGKIIGFIFYLSFILMLLINPIKTYINDKNIQKSNKKEIVLNNNNITYKENLVEMLKNSIRISYVGDLILLKDQVLYAKNNLTGKYEFDDMFLFTSKHFHESDLSIGVYEGPSAGNETNYSTSNFNDNIPLYLNYPDEFAQAVKNSGIELVTTANNHLLDKKIKGAIRTLDVLDKYNISHVGSYRNHEEKNKIKIMNIKGIRIAFLAYTSLMNYYQIDFLYEKYKYLTRIIPSRGNKYYQEIYNEIKNDFIRVKSESPDLIIVLAHMGQEFIHHTINFQDEWNRIFSDLGADIILGDHSHSLQPLQYIGKTFIVNSPGNFANSFIKMDGDSTAIIDIYIHKQSKKIIGASAIPMYTKEIKPKIFCAIPIYDLIYNKSIILNKNERKRVEEIQLMSTKVLVGKQFGINEIKKNYFFINNSYFDLDISQNNFCSKLNNYSNKKIYKYIQNSNSITFIGDSLTEGTKNGYHPWYEPMINCFRNKKIINISKGSYTTKLIYNNFKNEIINSKSDLYIIAIGTNDIRYREKSICAMDKNEYINKIKEIINLTDSKKSKYIFIAPWFSTFDDNISRVNHTAKKKLMKEYSSELEKYAKMEESIFIDPNEYLERKINHNKNKFLIDFIHPNNGTGIELYSESVFAN